MAITTTTATERETEIETETEIEMTTGGTVVNIQESLLEMAAPSQQEMISQDPIIFNDEVQISREAILMKEEVIPLHSETSFDSLSFDVYISVL